MTHNIVEPTEGKSTIHSKCEGDQGYHALKTVSDHYGLKPRSRTRPMWIAHFGLDTHCFLTMQDYTERAEKIAE